MWLWLGLTVWMLLWPPPAAEHELMKAYWVLGAVLALGTLFSTYIRRSYQVSYDEHAIYWRKAGLRGRFAATVELPFRAITDVFVRSEPLGIKPFDAAVLHSETQDVPDIWLSRWYLTKWAIKDILSEVARRTEASFDEQTRQLVGQPDEVGFQP